MNNLSYRAYNIESIKNEFLNIGFSEEAIDFVFLHNDNYNFEYLKEKIIDVEKTLRKYISNLEIKIDGVKNELNTKIDNVEKSLNTKIDAVEKSLNAKIDAAEKSLNTKIDAVEKSLQKDIFNLDAKIDNVEKNLQKDISNLNTKIDNVKSELTNKIENEVKDLRKDLNTGNRLIHFMILTAAILGPILNALFMKYLQFIK
ncbi:dGTP triphosphohydrolase [Borreliella spielmanii]|uniref:dGTP triphosphohydrolase n=1 Tax=Borreliella spielmanii TaxID=88916 RepID=A0ABR6P7Q1_9SPIR|nr:Bdr family repetitive protein [Borreliella spielmanii]MBB6032057.1 dGTP triphosphohydrolase [Borreliella spielmanii]